MCEYCRIENIVVMHTEDCDSCKVEVFVEFDQICVNTYDSETSSTRSICFDFPIRFCPMCGRAL